MNIYTVTNKNGEKKNIRCASLRDAVTYVQNYFDLSLEPYDVATKKTETETVTYRELARRVGDMVLNNQLRSATNDTGCDWECVNGSETIDEEGCEGEYVETYQDYIITDSGADYLKRVSNEILYYNEKLDVYIWAITHYGTSWDGVHTQIKA